MPRGAKVAIAALSVAVACLFALLIWQHVNTANAAARWLADNARLEELARKQSETIIDQTKVLKQQSAVIEQSQAEVAEITKERKAAEIRVRHLRAKLAKVESVPRRCRPELEKCHAVVEAQADELDLRAATERALRTTVAQMEERDEVQEARHAKCLELVETHEKRAEGWKKNSTRERRMGKVKNAMFAIGGLGVGFGGGVAYAELK